MNIPELSTGCLQIIMAGNNKYEGQPILQVLASKPIDSANAGARYRLLVSDGKFLQSFTMLATQLNHLIVNGQLADFTIFKVTQYITSVANTHSKPVLIIVGLNVLKSGNEVGIIIGEPIMLPKNALPNDDTDSDVDR